MESRWSKGSTSKLNTNIIDIYIFLNVVLIIVLKFIITFSYFIYIVLKLKNKYSFFFFFFIFNPLCRRTICQYVEHVLRLCTVLVFLPPFDFVHIYTVKSYPHTLSIKILLYTVKILQFVRLMLKVNYKNRII
jgi:hypothetical protein